MRAAQSCGLRRSMCSSDVAPGFGDSVHENGFPLHQSAVPHRKEDEGNARSRPPGPDSLEGPIHTGSLSEQLEHEFPYRPQSDFPAQIWQTWKYAPESKAFRFAFRAPTVSWTTHHPNFAHTVLSDDAALSLTRKLYGSVPAVFDAYAALPLPVLRADFFRYLVLLAQGGIYSDIDTTALRPATEWVPARVPRASYGLVVGIEADPDGDDWQRWFARRVQFCQWTIQAKAGHPVLRAIVANITEETLRRKREGQLDDVRDILEFTGPALWTDTIFAFFDEQSNGHNTHNENITWTHFTKLTAPKQVRDVVVLPITSFSPGIGWMGSGPDNDPMACVKHTFAGSWKPKLKAPAWNAGWTPTVGGQESQPKD
ncbi:nucleotide-diphospho-sugar transferase [Mycena rosella]|uniref:Nucleotide-diphospho-sugar transferase n=1 Tax=Mycena rosella TaxID=1033263 RepID=A0AAD7G8W7_MYCRO|nr:nucleotide-diphospho-sugar transferase [Mycena rosella]